MPYLAQQHVSIHVSAGNWFDVAHANLYFRTQVANVCGPFEGLFPIYPKIALTTICMGLDLIIQSIKMLLKVGHTICDDWKMFKVNSCRGFEPTAAFALRLFTEALVAMGGE